MRRRRRLSLARTTGDEAAVVRTENLLGCFPVGSAVPREPHPCAIGIHLVPDDDFFTNSASDAV